MTSLECAWNCLWLNQSWHCLVVSLLYSRWEKATGTIHWWSLQVMHMEKSFFFTECSTLEHSSNSKSQQLHQDSSRALEGDFLIFQHSTKVCCSSALWRIQFTLVNFYVLQHAIKITFIWIPKLLENGKRNKSSTADIGVYLRGWILLKDIWFSVGFCHCG